jgi:hypothetical protein
LRESHEEEEEKRKEREVDWAKKMGHVRESCIGHIEEVGCRI